MKSKRNHKVFQANIPLELHALVGDLAWKQRTTKAALVIRLLKEEIIRESNKETK